jgi:hypothetical protein
MIPLEFLKTAAAPLRHGHIINENHYHYKHKLEASRRRAPFDNPAKVREWELFSLSFPRSGVSAPELTHAYLDTQPCHA